MKPSDHLRFVDGLRACAILAVVVYHAWTHSPAAHASGLWLPASLGHHGVELFFVISGLCLAYPYLAGHATFDWHAFTAKRLVRIFPPFWIALALLVVFALTPAWQPLVGEPGMWAAHYSVADVAREALLLDGGPWHNISFWTLAVELRWYVVFPLALWVFTRSPRAVALIALTSWLLYYKSLLHVPDTLLLPAFLMGIFAADAIVRRPAWIQWAPVALCVTLAAALLAPAQWNQQTPLWQLSAFFFVVTVIATPWLQRACAWRPLVAVGVASYSIYLIHEPFVAWLQQFGLPPVVLIAVALALGFALWYAIERPLQLRAPRQAMVAAVEGALRRAATISLRELWPTRTAPRPMRPTEAASASTPN